MKRLLGFFTLLATVTWCVGTTPPPPASVGESEFFGGILRQLPTPKEGEFPTPESVVRAYFESLLQNRIGDTFKCVPLREKYAASNFKSDIEYTSVYSAQIPSPEDYYTRFIKALSEHYKAVNLLRYLLLWQQLDPEALKALEVRTEAKFKGGELDAEWLKSIAERTSLEKLRVYHIKSIRVEPRPGQPDRIHRLQVSDLAFATVTISGGGKEIQVEVMVAKVGGNYQILWFSSLPQL